MDQVNRVENKELRGKLIRKLNCVFQPLQRTTREIHWNQNLIDCRSTFTRHQTAAADADETFRSAAEKETFHPATAVCRRHNEISG